MKKYNNYNDFADYQQNDRHNCFIGFIRALFNFLKCLLIVAGICFVAFLFFIFKN